MRTQAEFLAPQAVVVMTHISHLPSRARPADGCPVPHFPPVRVRGGHPRLRLLLRHRRRAMAVGLAMTAAALAVTAPRAPAPAPQEAAATADPVRERRAFGTSAEQTTVTAPVRIADADAVRLLRPGDRVDVIAAGGSPGESTEPRVVASGARVSDVPEPGDGPAESGALVVLSVPRETAARLAGAAANARLAVTLR
ncbi:RcpC/CpaB family pilus assembly protein [Streptomyces sp. NPDC058284]|uniref:RcpC/CpaB family pilus assembly protein n=1 Tax=unclassified Streptomyces TaxID=2593676 RepID=UPI003669FA97